jgi:hypothetical protein
MPSRRTKVDEQRWVESTGDEKMNIGSEVKSRAARPFPRRERSVSLKMKFEIRPVYIGDTRGVRDVESRTALRKAGQHYTLMLEV